MSSLPQHPYHLQNGEHSHIAGYVPFDFGCSPALSFRNIPCFHYQTILITDAKVIYYIGTAIRSNGDLPKDWHSANLNHWLRLKLALLANASAKASC